MINNQQLIIVTPKNNFKWSEVNDIPEFTTTDTVHKNFNEHFNEFRNPSPHHRACYRKGARDEAETYASSKKSFEHILMGLEIFVKVFDEPFFYFLNVYM